MKIRIVWPTSEVEQEVSAKDFWSLMDWLVEVRNSSFPIFIYCFAKNDSLILRISISENKMFYF